MGSLVVFSHGKAASPTGRKISYLAPIAEAVGWRTLAVDYTDQDNPDDRVKRLLATDLGDYEKLVLVGSSMGGYVSAVASEILKPQGLFLMAPAFYLAPIFPSDGYTVQNPKAFAGKTFVTAGWNDDIVPVDSAIRFAREMKSELHIFNSDHVLWDVLPQIGGMLANFLKGL